MIKDYRVGASDGSRDLIRDAICLKNSCFKLGFSTEKISPKDRILFDETSHIAKSDEDEIREDVSCLI